MSDDPRDILKAAGVECPEEVESYFRKHRDIASDELAGWPFGIVCRECANDAILALARLVARYGYQLNLACVDICILVEDGPREGSSSAVHADLDRRWEEHNA